MSDREQTVEVGDGARAEFLSGLRAAVNALVDVPPDVGPLPQIAGPAPTAKRRPTARPAGPCLQGKTKGGLAWQVLHGDARKMLATLPPEHFHCVVTSPPYYWQRDYGVRGQIGLEWSIPEYVSTVADAMDGVRRVLRKDGLLFLNMGDTYYSMKGQPQGHDRKNPGRRLGRRAVDVKGLGVPQKTAIGIPWRVALEMIGRGWVLRSPIVWKREQPVPEPSVRDRPWRTHEMVFMFSRATRYHFLRGALEGDEDVWTIASQSRSGNHPAVFPKQLVDRCLRIGCPPHGHVLDPFAGSGTVLCAALEAGHDATGIELNKTFCKQIAARLREV